MESSTDRWFVIGRGIGGWAVDCSLLADCKRGFFQLPSEITGAK
jgi:hypothetical protein